LTALERQVAALQAQLGNACGQESCGTWSAYVGAELVLLDPHVGSPTGFFGQNGRTWDYPDYNFVAAPRIWLGIENPEGLGVRATYWSLDATATSDTLPLTTSSTGANVGLRRYPIRLPWFIWNSNSRVECWYGKIGQSTRSLDRRRRHVPGKRHHGSFEGFGPTLATRVRRAFG